ncbi:MAG: 4Fe-4S dicluster domain-containing protein, partial [Kofleriaceae bacterium]
PGHPARVFTFVAGFGRVPPELPFAVGGGATAVALVRGTAITPVTTRAAGGSRRLVRTQLQTSPLDRPIAPVFDAGELSEHMHALEELRGPVASLLPEVARTGLQWAMSIDTSICTGCSACVIACQAENNVQVVGPKEVARGRVMHWLRIDTYLVDRSEPGGGERVNQPMLCQHCEHAPCEYVCPVAATVHSPDGLNEQVYNRCIGTRFCSNNCPYKVRRFNWFSFEDKSTRSLQYNPEVTVRSRGVMEKCTYCVQRIRGAEHRARVEHREISPAEVVTACQQACPTGAIQFGALDHAPIAALRRDPRRYDVLHELGTRPRTQYLAKLKNPRTGP